jgi:hypothetical protein
VEVLVANAMLAVDLGSYSCSAALGSPVGSTVLSYPVPPAFDTAFLARIRADAQHRSGAPIDRLTVTASASAGTPAALVDAGVAAGFRDVEFLSPAVAAVLATQAELGLTSEALVLVCDLGQTWTTTLLRVAGRDVVEVAQESTGSVHVQAQLRTDLRWVVASCRSVLARACAGLGVAPASTIADVAAVVLVGGCAHLPSAHQVLHDGLTRPVLRPTEPELAVVRGALRFAASAADRRITADHPKWRVEPIAWNVPSGRARLVRWLLADGQPFARGAVLAQVRTADERVFDLTAPDEGVLVERRAGVGDVVGPRLTAVTKRPASCLSGDPPERRHALTATGEWFLTPDRRTLVECDAGQGQVSLWSVTDGALVDRFAFGPEQNGRIFVDPGGRLCVVAWNSAGAFSVWDLRSGRRMVRFRDGNTPQAVLVNEAQWRLTAGGEDSGAAGRYRRSVANVWDLRTGERLEKLTDNWRSRLSGYRDRSGADGFGTDAVSPDGRLRAVPVRTGAGTTAIALREATSEHEVFRTGDATGAPPRVAFSADGTFLIANWESAGGSQVDVWEL